MKQIGSVLVEVYGEVPIYNPGSTPDKVPHVMLEEKITEHQLDANRNGVLVRGGGFLRIKVRKETRNGKAKFTAS